MRFKHLTGCLGLGLVVWLEDSGLLVFNGLNVVFEDSDSIEQLDLVSLRGENLLEQLKNKTSKYK